MKITASISAMKVPLAVFVALLAYTALAADMVDLVVRPVNFGLNVSQGTTVTLTPTWPIRRSYGTNLVTMDPKSIKTDAIGISVFTNTLWGVYSLSVPGAVGTTWKLWVTTNFSGRVSAAVFLTNSSAMPLDPTATYYTAGQVEARLVTVASGVATNVLTSAGSNGIVVLQDGLQYTIASDTNVIASRAYVDSITGGQKIPPGVLTNGATATLHGSFAGALQTTNQGVMFYPHLAPYSDRQWYLGGWASDENVAGGPNFRIMNIGGDGGYFDMDATGAAGVSGSFAAQEYFGNGYSLTNLDGAAIHMGSVNSNALDALTKAQLALAGAAGILTNGQTGVTIGLKATNSAGNNVIYSSPVNLPLLSYDDSAGVFNFGTYFAGDATFITNLNANKLFSGIVPLARLSGITSNQFDTGTKAQLALAGTPGPKGDTGTSGAAGAAATVAMGTVYTNASGSAAGVTNRGSSSAAIFDFTIPVGPTGPAGSGGGLGTATNLAANLSATNLTLVSPTITGLTTNAGVIAAYDGASTVNRSNATTGAWIGSSDSAGNVRLAGTVTAGAVVTTNAIIAPDQFKFEFPQAGTERHWQSVWPIYLIGTPNSANGNYSNIVFKASGSGVVHELQFVMFLQDVNGLPIDSAVRNIWINIEYDGEVSPSTRFSLASALAWQHISQITNCQQSYETDFVKVHDRIGSQAPVGVAVVSTNISPSGYLVVPGFGNANWAKPGFTLCFPMPYTNGIRIWLEALAVEYDGELVPCIEMQYSVDSFYQDSVSADKINNLRFRVNESSNVVVGPTVGAGTVNVSGNIVTGSGTSFGTNLVGKCIYFSGDFGFDGYVTAVNSTTSLTLATNDVWAATGNSYDVLNGLDWFTRGVGKSGYIAGTTFGMAYRVIATGASLGPIFEGNIRFFLNQETEPSYSWTSTEEYFTGSWNFIHPFQQRAGGCVSLFHLLTGQTLPSPVPAGFGDCTFYRYFKSTPVRYINGIRCYMPVYAPIGSGNDCQATLEWATFYYENP